ncbi:bifunctional 2-polyprenyl-6-hydroxyphenol methylase/3-demethylubiquinol 3-O-methyltransferase UbiG [Glaesserella parasuis]|nr:bifunctional 2-polyprenyl-6-hydroxyphenol methylase/3-demethylubiquinol 3-O-methyltransferase UbiG [Glaesserella parasuis]MDP0319840.1 bifunctional 2-polyprenyl-6-hydroxyphenol methylase/3-demethylubiquinol 3-O-methyltransferase UbiG [Glaesserella parasuis]
MNNIDQQEVEKFEKMAKTWWDPQGDFKPIHLLNPLRLAYINDKTNGLFGKKVLDIGCGGGILSESMAGLGAIVTGIDMAADALLVARQHAESNHLNICYQQITVEDFLKQHCITDTEKFDIITCMEVLEHVPNPHSIIQSCKNLLKEDGLLFISTINRTAKAYMLIIMGAEYVLKMLPKGTHNFEKFIKPSELLRWCSQEDFECKEIVGYHFNPLTKNFWINKDINCNYIAVLQNS